MLFVSQCRAARHKTGLFVVVLQYIRTAKWLRRLMHTHRNKGTVGGHFQTRRYFEYCSASDEERKAALEIAAKSTAPHRRRTKIHSQSK